MPSHALTLYSVRYDDVHGDARPLGNVDGGGTNVVDLINDVVTNDLPEVDHERQRSLGLDGLEPDPVLPIVSYLFRYGTFGSRFDVTAYDDLNDVRYPAATDESNTHVLAAALLAAPTAEQGWLVTHSIGANLSMVSQLRGVVARGLIARNVTGRLHIDPAQLAAAWELMLEHGEVKTIVFKIPAARLGHDDLIPNLQLRPLGEIELHLKPARGWTFGADAANAIRQRASDGEIVVVRGENEHLVPSVTTLHVDFQGTPRRLSINTGEQPEKIPRLPVDSLPPEGELGHDWIRREARTLLERLGIEWP